MMAKDERARETALKRALKLAPGREAIEHLRAAEILFAETGDLEGAHAVHRAVEALLHLRVAAHGGPLMPVTKHYREGG